MQQTESDFHNKNQSDTTSEKALAVIPQSSCPPLNQNNEKSLVTENFLVNKLEKSLVSSINALEKVIDGIDGGKDAETGEDIINMDHIDAGHKLIDMAVKIVAVKERLK